MESYYHVFTFEEVIGLIADAIDGKAEIWDGQAYQESRRGAANQSMVGTLKWGANQLRAIAGLVRKMPLGEVREREVDQTEHEIEPPDSAEVIAVQIYDAEQPVSNADGYYDYSGEMEMSSNQFFGVPAKLVDESLNPGAPVELVDEPPADDTKTKHLKSRRIRKMPSVEFEEEPHDADIIGR